MKYRIVSDSSSNMLEFSKLEYRSVPLKICTQAKEYVDDENLDVALMVEEIKKQGGKSGSSCPNVQEWLDAFGDADGIFAVAITSNLSGSCNAAMQAREEYLRMKPDAQVCVLDTLSTGPEMRLIIEKLGDMIGSDMDFDAIETNIRAYMQHTHLMFALKSLTNLARNGRVNPAIAALAGALGIWVVGKASDEGTLEQMHKCRGEKKALKVIADSMVQMGYRGGKIRIDHCLNEEIAVQLKEILRERFPDSEIQIGTCGGLCSFYAEKGGFLIGFEDI